MNPTKKENSIGNHRTHIRMSKLGRALQAAITNTNWIEMARMLFRADTNSGRREEFGRLLSQQNKSVSPSVQSYNTDQLQYILTLMLILTTAENRTQELYQESFAMRCDAISKAHGLKDDQYWLEGEVPPEWVQLDEEFEQRSLQILLETLREYHLTEIADLVQTEGSEQFFDIIRSIGTQFVTVLRHPSSASSESDSKVSGSIPETLVASSQDKKA